MGSGQNGSGVAAQTTDWYDRNGNLIWSKDARGYLTYNAYDPFTGLLTETIQNVNSSTIPSNVYLPSSWSFPTQNGPSPKPTTPTTARAGSSKPSARCILTTAAPSVRTASWTVYDNADHTTYSAQGYATETSPDSGIWTVFTLTNPVSVTITTPDGQITDAIQAVLVVSGSSIAWSTSSPTTAATAVTLGSGQTTPYDLFLGTAGIGAAPDAYTAWTTYGYSHKQLVNVKTYYDILSSGPGTVTANYNETQYGYDPNGRQVWTETPDGTITRYVLDARGNVLRPGSAPMPTQRRPDSDPSDRNDEQHGRSLQFHLRRRRQRAHVHVLRRTRATSYTTYYQYDPARPADRHALAGQRGHRLYATTTSAASHGPKPTPAPLTLAASYSANSAPKPQPLRRPRPRLRIGRLQRVDQTAWHRSRPLPAHLHLVRSGRQRHQDRNRHDRGVHEVRLRRPRTARRPVHRLRHRPNTAETSGTWAAPMAVDSDDTILQQTQTWYDAASEAGGHGHIPAVRRRHAPHRRARRRRTATPRPRPLGTTASAARSKRPTTAARTRRPARRTTSSTARRQRFTRRPIDADRRHPRRGRSTPPAPDLHRRLHRRRLHRHRRPSTTPPACPIRRSTTSAASTKPSTTPPDGPC